MKIVNGWKLLTFNEWKRLTIFVKRTILDCRSSSEYASDFCEIIDKSRDLWEYFANNWIKSGFRNLFMKNEPSCVGNNYILWNARNPKVRRLLTQIQLCAHWAFGVLKTRSSRLPKVVSVVLYWPWAIHVLHAKHHRGRGLYTTAMIINDLWELSSSFYNFIYNDSKIRQKKSRGIV